LCVTIPIFKLTEFYTETFSSYSMTNYGFRQTVCIQVKILVGKPEGKD